MDLGAATSEQDQLGTSLRGAQTVAAAIPLVLPMLGFVLFTMGFRLVWPMPDAGVLRIAFIAVSASSFVVAPVLRALFLSRLENRSHAERGRIRSDEAEERDLATLRTLALTQVAVFELPLLLGFVLSVLTEAATDFVLFAPMAIVGWVMVFPRRSQWESWLDPVERGGIITG